MNTLTDPIYTEDIKGLSWKARIFTTQASRVLTPGSHWSNELQNIAGPAQTRNIDPEYTQCL